MPVHFSHKAAVNVSYISHICHFILLLLVIFISYLIVTLNILLSFLQATNIAFDRIFVYEIFLFAQLELSAVGLFSVLVVEISARALSGNVQWAGGKKNRQRKCTTSWEVVQIC